MGHVFIGKFLLGYVVATRGALDEISPDERISALTRHVGGDWGEVDPIDAEANDDAVENGGRILSAYRTARGVKFWIITEADRSVTTFLLPSEY